MTGHGLCAVFPNDSSQAVRLPAEYRFDVDTVLVEKVGDKPILVRHALEAQGTTIGNMDLSIGTHAPTLSAALVTNNLAHFQRIPGLRCETCV